jgi:hypothetical protein
LASNTLSRSAGGDAPLHHRLFQQQHEAGVVGRAIQTRLQPGGPHAGKVLRHARRVPDVLLQVLVRNRQYGQHEVDGDPQEDNRPQRDDEARDQAHDAALLHASAVDLRAQAAVIAGDQELEDSGDGGPEVGNRLDAVAKVKANKGGKEDGADDEDKQEGEDVGDEPRLLDHCLWDSVDWV